MVAYAIAFLNFAMRRVGAPTHPTIERMKGLCNYVKIQSNQGYSQMDIFKEVFTAMNSRIRSPIIGSIALVFCSINWKPIFFVIFSGALAENRFSFFDANTSIWTLFVMPIGLGLFLAWAAPWISFFGAKLAQSPIDHKKKLEIVAEHALIIARTKLESERRVLLETEEETLIDQATRDEKINLIEDDSVRENLQTQIDTLRQKSGDFFQTEQSDISPAEHQIKMHQKRIENLKDLLEVARNSGDDSVYQHTQKKITEAYLRLDEYLENQRG